MTYNYKFGVAYFDLCCACNRNTFSELNSCDNYLLKLSRVSKELHIKDSIIYISLASHSLEK